MNTIDQVRIAQRNAAEDAVIASLPPELRAKAGGGLPVAEQLKQEAQIHAQEARTANATIAEIYQLVTGKTGEPGNWHGAEPVRKALAERDALAQSQEAEIARLLAALEEISEVSKTAWRALCDAEAVLNTLDGDDTHESLKLDELIDRVKDCAGNLFCVLRLPLSALTPQPTKDPK